MPCPCYGARLSPDPIQQVIEVEFAVGRRACLGRRLRVCGGRSGLPGGLGRVAGGLRPELVKAEGVGIRYGPGRRAWYRALGRLLAQQLVYATGQVGRRGREGGVSALVGPPPRADDEVA